MMNGINNPNGPTGGIPEKWESLKETFEGEGYRVVTIPAYGEYMPNTLISTINDVGIVAGEMLGTNEYYSQKIAETVINDINNGDLKDYDMVIFVGYSGGGQPMYEAATEELVGVRNVDILITMGSPLLLDKSDRVIDGYINNVGQMYEFTSCPENIFSTFNINSYDWASNLESGWARFDSDPYNYSNIDITGITHGNWPSEASRPGSQVYDMLFGEEGIVNKTNEDKS